MRSPKQLAAVAVGGSLGSLLRVGLGEWIPVGAGLPWPTLLANIVGSAVLGALVALPRKDGDLRLPLLGIGFCGGLTTFSALCWELFDLLDKGSAGTALAYASVSLVLGLGAAVAANRFTLQAIAAEEAPS
ncbi:MAG: CrcB family protein [Solirubrobacterales bacterium]|nr:CrcB family protein [Solirubrobacterales bacterium]